MKDRISLPKTGRGVGASDKNHIQQRSQSFDSSLQDSLLENNDDNDGGAGFATQASESWNQVR